jgi:glycosyltransferase involved in cell wall biosynthesis
MKVLFIHENTLGHGSYLPPFVEHFAKHPELGIEAELINATPLPDALAKKADRSIPLLRRFGLDQHFARWRRIVSAHVRELVEARRAGGFDAVVVNTQSVALDLADLPRPLFVALDATFSQLAQSRWFGEPPSHHLGPRLISALIQRERKLFERADRLLPWSGVAAGSLTADYGIAASKISILPPSVEIPPLRRPPRNAAPRALFIGADFKRKGGELLVAAYRRSFQGALELDLVTESTAPSEPGVRVHRRIRARTPEWRELWNGADLFIFPSQLETFGIVLIEALAFGVPIISSRAGAAEEILAGGQAGLLLDTLHAEEIGAAIDTLLADREGREARATFGRARAESEYNLHANSARLAELLRAAR